MICICLSSSFRTSNASFLLFSKCLKGRIVVEYVRTKICYIVTCSWYKFLDDECTFKYLFFKIKINQAINIHHLGSYLLVFQIRLWAISLVLVDKHIYFDCVPHSLGQQKEVGVVSNGLLSHQVVIFPSPQTCACYRCKKHPKVSSVGWLATGEG